MPSQSIPKNLNGWAAPGKGKQLENMELPLKTFEDDDVDMEITHCGICGSDIHTIDSGWGPTTYPCVVGHEITGIATAVGKNVTHIKVGDRIGVGAQSGSCGECENCKSNQENICLNIAKATYTYNSKWPNGDEAYGGYADKWRGSSRFVFKVPDNMSNEIAATFFCAGITTYAPLKRYNVTKGSKVGVIGIGGLGHFATQWAKAMGAEVIALSSSDRKREDAANLGCDEYVVTSNKDDMQKHFGTMTHIICTAYSSNFDWVSILSLLKTNGTFILVGLPESPLQGIPAGILAVKQITLCGSLIGSPSEIQEMLEFADKTGVRPWIQKYSMSDVNKAIADFREGKPRYRFVLEN
ncbi:chaperonin 10-like protein [Umbelopsis sp. PMI_123]|nr:chaperonin 10-like protein [Umbelopsis sp. PMI_123]